MSKQASKPEITLDEAVDKLVQWRLDTIQKENERRNLASTFLREHISDLLKLRPEHDRTSCSDARPQNRSTSSEYPPRCMRCQLLYLQQLIRQINSVEGWGIEFQVSWLPALESDETQIRREVLGR